MNFMRNIGIQAPWEQGNCQKEKGNKEDSNRLSQLPAFYSKRIIFYEIFFKLIKERLKNLLTACVRPLKFQ